MSKQPAIDIHELGAHRGARALIRATSSLAGRHIARWSFTDAKAGRSDEAAAFARDRFPRLRTAAFVGDGVEAAGAAKNAVVVATMDTPGATAAAIAARGDAAAHTLFQLVGNVPGGAASTRLAIAGSTYDPETSREARLLLLGLESLTSGEATSSAALTRNGDPIMAALLAPMRAAASAQTARYLTQIGGTDASAEPPLVFFTTSGRYPLAVVEHGDERISRRETRALQAASRFPLLRVGGSVVVAFVDVAERIVEVLFVERTPTDARRVTGLSSYRVPTRRLVRLATFSD